MTIRLIGNNFSINEVTGLAKQMINHRLVTKQTKPEGALVEKVINFGSILS